MSRPKSDSQSKPSMIVDIYKRYQKRKKQAADRAWEDDYFYMYGIESDERVMENLELAGKLLFLVIYVAPFCAIGAAAFLVKYLLF